MAQYTSNIGLHQWEPTDNFLRADFNQDFAKIDAAFGDLDPRFASAETARGWLEDTAARIGYEALQGRMAAEAEGKALPSGRGILFHNFSSDMGLTLTGGCAVKNGGGILLDTGPGLVSFDHYFGQEVRSAGIDADAGRNYREVTFTAAGSGTLNVLKTYIKGVSGSTATLALLQGTNTLWNQTVSMTGSVSLFTARPGIRLVKGTVYAVRITRGINAISLYSSGPAPFGFQCECTPSGAKSGMVTIAPRTVPPFRSLRSWVRHTGGKVGCAVSKDNAAFQSMTLRGSRSVIDLRGTACTESEFEILVSSPPMGGGLRVQISIQADSDVSLCDFGAVLI